ncbi:hypothetical protein LOD99_9467 [Oopsacas minuta]|uniref:Uncharacterized protein n=1 Tax=Oopsacas minuta TaxID=111878 RepID=A0AAV7JBT5_9METZ|nr:hypothetical protein LOD99_9467 [Oopsacas minuta]
MNKIESEDKESYFEKIEIILKLNWRADVRSGKKLNQIIDTKELCSLKKELLEVISENLNVRDTAELKNLRLEWNGKYSVERRKYEPIKLENEIKRLVSEKNKLISEKKDLKVQICCYSNALYQITS